MKLRSTLILVIVLAFISSIVTGFIIDRNRIVQVQTYVMDVEVKDDYIMGFNVDPDGFHFGSLSRGSGAARELKIHQVEEDVLVTIKKEGDMAGWISYPNNFIVNKGDNRTIRIAIGIPTGVFFGNYTGEITVVLRKA